MLYNKNNNRTILPQIINKQIFTEQRLHTRPEVQQWPRQVNVPAPVELAFSWGQKAIKTEISKVQGGSYGEKCQGKEGRQRRTVNSQSPVVRGGSRRGWPLKAEASGWAAHIPGEQASQAQRVAPAQEEPGGQCAVPAGSTGRGDPRPGSSRQVPSHFPPSSSWCCLSPGSWRVTPTSSSAPVTSSPSVNIFRSFLLRDQCL